MKLLMILLMITTSNLVHAESVAMDGWERMENMVRTGAITPEAAQKEKIHKSLHHLEARREAQRGLASIDPDLTPVRLKHVKIEPMILFID